MARRKRSARRPKIRAVSAPDIVNIIFKSIPFLVAAALIVLVVKFVGILFFESDYFKIKDIRIANEASHGKNAPVMKILKSKKGLNIFRVDLKACESDIEYRYPEFKDIRISRVLPDRLEISYKVRIPFLQVDSGYYYFVSDDAVILPDKQVAADPQLTTITGIRISEKMLSPDRLIFSKQLEKAISLLKEIKESGFFKEHKIIKINVYDLQNPAIYIEDDTRIELGEYNFKEKEELLKEVLRELESKGKQAKVIDLRFEDVVIVPR